MDTETLSYILSIISLVFYSIVYVPQFIVIFAEKSSDGISLFTLSLWTQADILSLIGTLVLVMPTSIVVIGWYHFFMGVFMMFFIVYYKTGGDSKILIYSYVLTFALINTTICIILQLFMKESNDTVGLILGWITTSMYIIGRFPQIYLNIKRKSTQGLSLLMYIFTITANTIYAAILLLYPESLDTNMPWIAASVINTVLDIFVICQHYYYEYRLKKITEIIRNEA